MGLVVIDPGQIEPAKDPDELIGERGTGAPI
jgi:hypothetical protein